MRIRKSAGNFWEKKRKQPKKKTKMIIKDEKKNNNNHSNNNENQHQENLRSRRSGVKPRPTERYTHTHTKWGERKMMIVFDLILID